MTIKIIFGITVLFGILTCFIAVLIALGIIPIECLSLEMATVLVSLTGVITLATED